MVNQEIFFGLKSALERGQTLKRAMFSFYNAGYEKQEIEEAARELRGEGATSMPSEKLEAPSSKVIEKAMKQATQEISKVSHQVSSYGELKTKNGNLAIIILIVVLVLLLGALIAIFLLREQVIAWLSKLF